MVSFIKAQLFLSKVDLMKQNNEEQLEPRTKSSFSNIFPAPSFDEHDSPEEQLKKLVQLGESVILMLENFCNIFTWQRVYSRPQTVCLR